MTSDLDEIVGFIRTYKSRHPDAQKDGIAAATAAVFNLSQVRKVYVSPTLAVRFCHAGGSSFANVVLSLSALRAWDDRPFIVVIVRAQSVEFLLANTTFLTKISHSSHEFRLDNVRGSFLGHDIMRRYGTLDNKPENFAKLFELHRVVGWVENVARLATETAGIVGTGARTLVTESSAGRILAVGELAASLTSEQDYLDIAERIAKAVVKVESEILTVANEVDNVNLRGNRIEQLITAAGSFHSIQDMEFRLSSGVRVLVDIKTKLLHLGSNPKGFNIDKYLGTLANGKTAISYFFVGIDVTNEAVRTVLVSTLDSSILARTHVQFHWAGRNSRGVTQLTGDPSALFKEDFKEVIEIERARVFLQELIDL